MENNPIWYIPGWTYIRWAIYPTNKHDTCGYTAACLLLNYYNNLPGPLQGKMIPKEFFGPNGKLKTTGYTLQDKLLTLDSSAGSGDDILSVRAVIDFNTGGRSGRSDTVYPYRIDVSFNL